MTTSSRQKNIEEVLAKHTDHLMAIPGVVGTALGMCHDRPCIKVFVAERTPALESAVPTTLEGYPVSLEQVGEIHALPGGEGGP